MQSLPQILIYQSSQRHSLPDTLQLPTRYMFPDSLSRMAQYAAGEYLNYKPKTQSWIGRVMNTNDTGDPAYRSGGTNNPSLFKETKAINFII